MANAMIRRMRTRTRMILIRAGGAVKRQLDQIG
jgi:hypothetical protein